MGAEYRANGRRDLDRNRRVNGNPVKEYLAADDDIGFVMADDLRRIRRRQASVRRLSREVAAAHRKRIDDLPTATDAATEHPRHRRRTADGGRIPQTPPGDGRG